VLRLQSRFLCLLAALAFFATPAHAVVTYCVGTPGELQGALDQAEADGDDSRIDVRAGSYALNSTLRYQPDLEWIMPAGSLQIEGGYGAGCASQVYDATATVFHGNGSANISAYTETSSIMVKTISLDNASIVVSDNVLADGCYSSHLEFEFRRVRINGGTLAVAGTKCHEAVVRDSLLTNGHATADSIPSDASFYIYLNEDDDVDDATSLTMINTTVAEGRAYFYTCCDYRGAAFLYNNIFRASGDEILAEATNVYAVYNRYDTIDFSGTSQLPAGDYLPGTDNNTSVNPDLDANYRPNPDSPMVNTGTANVPEGLLSLDVYGGPRVIGFAVDRGAVESPVDGTSIYTVTNTNASGAGSLAEAITLANNDSGFNQIRFDIPGSCPRRIALADTLHVRDSVSIDGTTQTGSVLNDEDLFWNAVPCVILDGAGSIGTAISTDPQIGNGHVTVRGLAFEGFDAALLLSFGNQNFVYGSQFGGRIGESGPVLSGNGDAIIVAAPATAVIGGSDPALANLIGGSSGAGVLITGNSDGNQVIGNRIGVDKDVIHDLPNLDGVRIFTADNRVTGNRISTNTRDGILVSGDRAHGNTIRDNTIGGNTADFLGLPGNGRMGVMIDDEAHANDIGPGNLIARNGDSGVRVTSAARGYNSITGNDIGRNGAPGIDLGSNGVTDNDFDPLICEITHGCSANRGQNYPTFAFAYRFDGSTIYLYVSGHLTTTVSSSPYRLDIYASDACDVSGHGQGERWLGSHALVVESAGICADNNCTASFGFPLEVTGAGVAVGHAITATATSPSGDTSEFSECMTVEDGQIVADTIFEDGFDD